MIPSSYITSVTSQFGPLTEREIAIFQMGYASGMHKANNDAQSKLGDLDLRIHGVSDTLRKAIEALHSPSF